MREQQCEEGMSYCEATFLYIVIIISSCKLSKLSVVLARHHRLIDRRNRARLAVKVIIDWVTTTSLRLRQVHTARGVTADETRFAKGLVQCNDAHRFFLARLRGDWLLALFALWRMESTRK